jgi:hypothetical protein
LTGIRYSRYEFEEFAEYPIPELLRTPIESVVLQIMALNLGNPRDVLVLRSFCFPFFFTFFVLPFCSKFFPFFLANSNRKCCLTNYSLNLGNPRDVLFLALFAVRSFCFPSFFSTFLFYLFFPLFFSFFFFCESVVLQIISLNLGNPRDVRFLSFLPSLFLFLFLFLSNFLFLASP